jgi:hypothetical protein
MLASSEDTQPTVVNEDAGCVMGDSPHRASRRDLSCIEGSIGGRWGSRKYLDGYRCIADPLLHERPSGLLAIDKFGEGTHVFLRANETAKRPPPAETTTSRNQLGGRRSA